MGFKMSHIECFKNAVSYFKVVRGSVYNADMLLLPSRFLELYAFFQAGM